MPNLPERQGIADIFEGVIIQVDDHFALATTEQNSATTVHKGLFVVRYGLQYLGKPQYCITPDLIALDYGNGLNGEAMWDFILNKSNLYPRADILGYRNDGLDEMIVLKSLDLAVPPELLVYTSKTDTIPLTRTYAFIGDTDQVSVRIIEYATVYPDVDTWLRDMRDE